MHFSEVTSYSIRKYLYEIGRWNGSEQRKVIYFVRGSIAVDMAELFNEIGFSCFAYDELTTA